MANRGRYVALNRLKFCSMWPMFETRRPTNTLWYFLFVRICLTSDRPGALIRRAPEVGGQALQKTLAAFVFIVQNESCLPLKDSPCHHTRSGRDWPGFVGFAETTLAKAVPARMKSGILVFRPAKRFGSQENHSICSKKLVAERNISNPAVSTLASALRSSGDHSGSYRRSVGVKDGRLLPQNSLL